MNSAEREPAAAVRGWRKWAVWAVAAVVVFLLLVEHRADALGWWLHVLVGVCLLLLYLLMRSGADGAGARGGG